MGCSSSKQLPTVETVESKADETILPQKPMEENKKLTINDFELLKTVGQGSFGKVFQVRMKENGKIYAMKVLNKQRVMELKQYEHTLAERRIMEDISHPFLVCLRYAFQSQSKLYLVMDFFNGGELFHYLSMGRFSENRAKFYAAEIAMGIGHLHDHNIVYRDLKPENLILDSEGHIRITDFGLSKKGVEGDTAHSLCGTPEYLAPEIIRKMPYGKSVDWWSLGILIYEMINGLPPFYDTNRKLMYHRILTASVAKTPYMSPEAFDIVYKLLQRDPKARLGYNGFAEIQSHPWFRDINWDALYKKEIVPPFRPTVKDEESTEQIDSEFTNIVPAVTPTPVNAVLVDQNAFQDFSYAEGNVN
ncbi:protein kinase 2 [Blastocystis sp. ATCC 50177/Nand II]|uniref:non-specific serine/threonine protein kinase n=1 Tax=Blastocystis sp. subtype 1 (strain ATCC 50177 / NandII) TaxID=478820 RepID=A0A196SE08_BLAHN|nr:protein kinase 2 [Blastocystis sp. ATCC 50177/Nand II]